MVRIFWNSSLTNEYIPVPEPFVGDNTAIAGLEGKLDRVVRVVEVEQVQGLPTDNQAAGREFREEVMIPDNTYPTYPTIIMGLKK